MCDIISLNCAPAWMWFGHHMMPGHAPAAFERRAFLATERRGSRIWIGIQPRAIVGGHDHDRIGCDGPDGVHDLADIGVKLHQRVRVVPEMRLAGELRRRIGRVVHLEEIDVHEERLVAVGVLLDVVDGVVGLLLVEGGKSLVGDLAEVLWPAGRPRPPTRPGSRFR